MQYFPCVECLCIDFDIDVSNQVFRCQSCSSELAFSERRRDLEAEAERVASDLAELGKLDGCAPRAKSRFFSSRRSEFDQAWRKNEEELRVIKAKIKRIVRESHEITAKALAKIYD